MKPYFLFSLFIAIFAVIVGCSPLTEDQDLFVSQIISDYPELKDKQYEVAMITRIVDGDTYVTDSGDKIRLIGVNTPEISGKAQYYGREATEFSKKLLDNQTVYMFRDVSNTDKYGRLLRYLFIQNDPVMFNETLLKEGYANTMTIPPNVMFADKFVKLERESRLNNKGLWKENENPSVDQQKATCTQPKIKGNINSRNEKIFHVPGGRNYEATKAEEMFCSEEEAIAAGYRKAKN